MFPESSTADLKWQEKKIRELEDGMMDEYRIHYLKSGEIKKNEHNLIRACDTFHLPNVHIMGAEEKDSKEWEDLHHGWNNSGKLPKFGGNITHLKGSINSSQGRIKYPPTHREIHTGTHTHTSKRTKQPKKMFE